MAWNTGLVGTVLDIARCEDNPLRVMAGPGTGKSFAMKRRVARLLEDGIEPSRILAVTFTRNAANSLLDDLHNLGIDGCGEIHSGTLHSFCFRLLGRDDVFAFLDRTARPLIAFSTSGVLRFEAEPLIKDICGAGNFGGMRDCTKRIHAFEAAWARLQSDDAGWPADPTDQEFQTALIAWLRFHQAILIGELVPEALRYLRGNPTSASLHAYDHVIVDEYQDLNKAEQELLDLLSRNGNQAIVGDVDQSIYSFRHANPEGITQFADTRPGTHDETLDTCRRYPRKVVQLAAHLIKHNHPPRVPPRLNPRPANPDGEVHIVQWNSLSQEAIGLAAFIRSLIDRDHSPGDILVLSPRRIIGYGIRDAINNQNISVHSFYDEEPLESEEAQKALILLTLAANPDDRVALRWWLGAGSPTWRVGQYSNLRIRCENTDESPRDTLQQLADGSVVIPQTNQMVARYNELKTRLASLADKSLVQVVDDLFPENQDWAISLRAAAVSGLEHVENVADLKAKITIAVTQREVPESGDFVRVMSLHKSKGLTSKAVIVSGCSEGLIPFIPPDEPSPRQAELLNEQRRLFYVAITRCTERLVLSSANFIDRGLAHRIGAKTRPDGSTITSRFIDELGPTQPASIRGLDWQAANFVA